MRSGLCQRGNSANTAAPERSKQALAPSVDVTGFFAPDQMARRLSAEDLRVLRSITTSKETFCPSLRLCIPARSTALMCTNTSWLPSSGWMNPKPFWLLNHFTVPCVITTCLSGGAPHKDTPRQDRRRVAHMRQTSLANNARIREAKDSTTPQFLRLQRLVVRLLHFRRFVEAELFQ